MKFSVELITSLMKTIREVERLNGSLEWYEHNDIIKKQILDNEMYYSQKIKNQNMKKINFYESKILNGSCKYEVLINETQERIKLRSFNQMFISEMQRGLGYELYELYDITKYDKEKIDSLVNAAELYQEIYTNYPNNNYRAEFASAMCNAYLSNRLKTPFTMFFAEVVNSNYPLFTGAVINIEKWPIVFIRLLHGQIRKNNERIRNTHKLIEQNKVLFANYSKGIEDYVTKETVFTISSFIESNDISYNTGKKYLKDLVEKGILQPIKIGKHNAFVYQSMYDIWLK